MTLSIPLMIIGTIASLALLLCLRLLVVTRLLKGELKDLRQKIITENNTPEVKANFSESLTQVERKVVPISENPGTSSDKYRYVVSLANQGVDAKGIAAALQMAPAEVEQLMQLTRLKKQALDVEH